MKSIFYYVFFPYIALMRILHSFIKTEMRMIIALCLISQALWTPFQLNLIQWPILIEIAIGLYLPTAIVMPLFYYETDVKRRRLNGSIPIEERHR